jgi:nucleotide-binding universal stress UspA family protein
MKKILVATDFSEASSNAVNYAAEMALSAQSVLILFHTYHPPVIVSEVPMPIPTLDEIEKDCQKHLKKIAKKLKSNYTEALEIKTECVCGLAVDEIIEYVKKNSVDLVIMGMHGAGYLTEKMVGSTTTTLIQKANFPVLTIDSKVKYKKIKRITLACDYMEIKDKTILDPIKMFAQQFKSHLYILNVLNKLDTRPTIEEAVSGVKLETAVEGLTHSFHYIKNDDIVDGINTFASINKIDLIAMIPRKHSLFKSIFKESTTKRMAFHSHIPLLTVHE